MKNHFHTRTNLAFETSSVGLAICARGVACVWNQMALYFWLLF